MKQLLLIRHAKSSWADASQNDFDRPLNERGKSDAPVMAKRLVRHNIKVDAFISSPAKRAKKTCELFAEGFDRKKEDIVLKSELYLAAPGVFEKVISELSDDIETAAIFAHNPGITSFANTLTSTRVDDMPTCSVYAVKINTHKWKHFSKAKKEFLFFDCPKVG
jgi:phosphohistidine phosphatase